MILKVFITNWMFLIWLIITFLYKNNKINERYFHLITSTQISISIYGIYLALSKINKYEKMYNIPKSYIHGANIISHIIPGILI